MIWSSFLAAGPGALLFIEEIMDQNAYIDFLKTNLPESVDKLSFGADWQFYQDKYLNGYKKYLKEIQH